MRAARCFVRAPPPQQEGIVTVSDGDRPKVVLLGADTSFEAFKARCAAKLGIASSGDDITLLLGSQTGSINLHSAPEIEALDEISPDDLLIVLPRSASAAPAGTSTEGEMVPERQPLQEEEYEVKDDRELSAAEEEEDGEEEEEGDPIVMSPHREAASGGGSGGSVSAAEDEEDGEEEEEEGEQIDLSPHREPARGVGSGGSGSNGQVDKKRSRQSRQSRQEPTKRVPSAKRPAKPKASMEAVLEDDVEVRGVSESGAGGAGSSSGHAHAHPSDDDALIKIKERIRKMLSLGLHAETGEAEAEASMRMAEKLLSKHNLRQADVLHEDHVPVGLRAGKAVVHLRSTKDHSPCQTRRWMQTLCTAVTTNFECSAYFNSHGQAGGRFRPVCDFTFYGIGTNASLAAFAFAAAFNRIAILSAAHVLPPDEYETKKRRGIVRCGSKGAYTSAARESYRVGLARGLYDAVLGAKKTKELETTRRLELARSKASPLIASDCL
jgi:hypothetical protein